MTDDSIHLPVLLREAVDALAVTVDSQVVDCTFGRGGHSSAILAVLGPTGRLMAMDRDPQAVESPAAQVLRGDSRFALEHGSFSLLRERVKQRNWLGQVDGVLFDLGVSSPQLDTAERGFSFQKNGPLDMRMDNRSGLTAADWLNRAAEAEIAAVLRDLGEERFARRIAGAIVTARMGRPLETTAQLARIIEQTVPTREPGKHPATRSFQAIRMLINEELGEIEAGLRQAVDVLAPGGRIAVIAFHSLEDRLVKRFLRNEERGGEPPHRKLPIVDSRSPRLKRVGGAVRPGADEISNNPRARSAVLRVAERL